MHQRKKDFRHVSQEQGALTGGKTGHATKIITMPLRAWGFVACLLSFYVLLLSFVVYRHGWLPQPKSVDVPTHEFSEARARTLLQNMLQFGIRTVGSKANEEDTPRLLLAQIEKIQASASPKVRIQVEKQQPSGAFGLHFFTNFQNVYANITNILVKVTPTKLDETMQDPPSLLISSHYDSAIGALGASDDGVNIAIMLELLQNLAQRPPQEASVVFNFNGAEETILQAAHGFITQHPWRDSIKAFINLEAAGAGGREILFQTGSDVLTMAYAEGSKYPHASTIAEEIFQSGVIPSDTDFRIYRDYGEVPGMDFAYVENGYVYHTILDNLEQIQPGSIQRFGDNLYGSIRAIVDTPGLLQGISMHSAQSGRHVMFDVLGFRVLSFLASRVFLFHYALLFLGILFFALSTLTLKERIRGIQQVGFAFATAIACSAAVAIVLSIYAPMTWYASPILSILVYGSSALFGLVFSLESFFYADRVINANQPSNSHLASMEKRDLTSVQAGMTKSTKQTRSSRVMMTAQSWKHEQMIFEGYLFVWMLFTGFLLFRSVRSVYAAGIWIVCPLVARLLSMWYHRRFSKNISFSPNLYLWIHFLGLVPPILFSAQSMLLCLSFFIPIMGRAGTATIPDLVIGEMICLFVCILLSYSLSFLALMEAKALKMLKFVLLALCLVSVFVSCVREPYSPSKPKRLFVQHILRRFSDTPQGLYEDSGLWLNALDYPALNSFKSLMKKTPWSDALHPPSRGPIRHNLFDNFPWFLPLKGRLPLENSWYLPCPPPKHVTLERNVNLQVISSTYDAAQNTRKIHLLFTGPSHMTMYIDASETTLTSWSLGNGRDGVPPSNNESYYIHFASGKIPARFHFWLEANSNASIALAFAGHFLDDDGNETAAGAGAAGQTTEIKQLLTWIPEWTSPIAFVSLWESRYI